MADASKSLNSNFEAVISAAELEDGELLHAEIDSMRKIAMHAGLTNSSDKLNLSYLENPNGYLNALKFGIRSYDHYDNLLLMMGSAISRLYTIAADQPEWKNNEDKEQIENFISKINSLTSSEIEH